MERNDQNGSAGGALTLERCYEILELQPGAGLSEIKTAYRSLAFVWHPDRFPNDNRRLRSRAEEHFKQLNAAYHTLMDALASGPVSPPFHSTKANRNEAGNRSTPDRRGFPRRAAVFVCIFLVAALAAVLLTAGLRYLRIERAHREVRSRLAVSEGKKEALLAAAKRRQTVQSELQTTGKEAPSRPLVKKAALPSEPRSVPVSSGNDAAGGSQPAEKSDSGSGHPGLLQERARIDALIAAGRSFEKQGRFGEAQQKYRAALTRIESSGGLKAPLEKLQRQLRGVLASDRIRLGAAGYRFYGGRWYSPEAVRTEFVHYRGARVHYSALKPAAERFADPLVRSHLRAAFPSKLLHKNKVNCIALNLIENQSAAASFQALYRWEVWTFQGVEKGQLSLDLVYRPGEDSWEAVWLTKR